MDLEFSETQKQIRAAVRDLLKKECPLNVSRAALESEKGYSEELWQTAAELGWLTMPFPEKYGGDGSSLLDLAVIYEEMGRSLMTSPHLASVVLSGLTILAAGNDAQKDLYLPRIGSGEQVFTLALDRPECAGDASVISTHARAQGGGFLLNGTVLFVPYAHAADHIICVARTADGAPEESCSLFIVDRESTGLQCRRLSGFLGEPLGEVVLDNVQVPRENLLGEANRGWQYLKRPLQIAQAMQCCEMVGGSDFVLELTINYSKTRKQFGDFIGSFQRVQDRIINILNDLDKARLATYDAVWRLSEGLPGELEVATAQAIAGEAYANICDESHYVHAGTGFMVDYDLHPYTRKARTVKEYLGSPAFHRRVIARELRKAAFKN